MSVHLEPVVIDLLSEAMNVGAAHMATALSEITGEPIALRSPRVMALTFDEVAHDLVSDGSDVLGMFSWVNDGLSGLVCTVLSRPGAWRDVFLHRLGAGDEALPEIANIMAASFVAAIADLTSRAVSMHPPGVAHVPRTTAVATMLAQSAGRDPMVILTAELTLSVTGAEARVFYVPDAVAITTLCELLG